MRSFYNQANSTLTPIAPFNYIPSNEHAAWFAIAYTVACINGDISEEARKTFCKLITSKSFFSGHQTLDYFFELKRISDLLPPKEIIRAAARLINTENAPTLFCIIVEILLTKGYLTRKEESILDYLSLRLALDDNLTDKITEVLLIKNKGNWIS